MGVVSLSVGLSTDSRADLGRPAEPHTSSARPRDNCVWESLGRILLSDVAETGGTHGGREGRTTGGTGEREPRPVTAKDPEGLARSLGPDD